MTREEKLEKLTTLEATSRQVVLDYNAAILDGKFDIAASKKKDLDDAIGEYSAIAGGLALDSCAKEPDPMLAAVRDLEYQVIATVKRKKDKDDHGPDTFDIDFKPRKIDILKLYQQVPGGVGQNKNWPYMIEKFNLLLTARMAREIGADITGINDSYAMSKIAREYDLGEEPASKTKILNTLTNIVQAMIGESYKATSHDVQFLLWIYGRKSRTALRVSAANHKALREYIQEICHRIVTGKTYSVDYKKAKP